MYHGFLDNNMPSGILAEYFRKSTVQRVSICASIRVVGDVTSFRRGLPKTSPGCSHCLPSPAPLYALLNLLGNKQFSQASDFLLTTPVSLSLHFRGRYCRVSFGRIRKKAGRNISKVIILTKGMVQLLII